MRQLAGAALTHKHWTASAEVSVPEQQLRHFERWALASLSHQAHCGVFIPSRRRLTTPPHLGCPSAVSSWGCLWTPTSSSSSRRPPVSSSLSLRLTPSPSSSFSSSSTSHCRHFAFKTSSQVELWSGGERESGDVQRSERHPEVHTEPWGPVSPPRSRTHTHTHTHTHLD